MVNALLHKLCRLLVVSTPSQRLGARVLPNDFPLYLLAH